MAVSQTIIIFKLYTKIMTSPLFKAFLESVSLLTWLYFQKKKKKNENGLSGTVKKGLNNICGAEAF